MKNNLLKRATSSFKRRPLLTGLIVLILIWVISLAGYVRFANSNDFEARPKDTQEETGIEGKSEETQTEDTSQEEIDPENSAEPQTTNKPTTPVYKNGTDSGNNDNTANDEFQEMKRYCLGLQEDRYNKYQTQIDEEYSRYLEKTYSLRESYMSPTNPAYTGLSIAQRQALLDNALAGAKQEHDSYEQLLVGMRDSIITGCEKYLR